MMMVAAAEEWAVLEAQARRLADSDWSPVRAAVSKKSRASAMHDHEHEAAGSASTLLSWRSSWPDLFEEFAELVSVACVAAARFVRGTASAATSCV